MEKANAIKLRFLKNGVPAGREYSYLAPSPVAVGDYVETPSTSGTSTAIVTAVNVPEAEIAPFRGRVKSIVGRALSKKVRQRNEERPNRPRC